MYLRCIPPVEHAESSANGNRRTLPSPPILNNTFETIRGRPARLSETGSSSENNVTRIRRANGFIRRLLRTRLSMTAKIKNLEKSVSSLTKTVQKLTKKAGQRIKDNVEPEKYPELEEKIIVEGERELIEIDGLKIDSDTYACLLLQKSLRRRANLLMHEMWPPNIWLSRPESVKFIRRPDLDRAMLRQQNLDVSPTIVRGFFRKNNKYKVEK